MSGTGDLFRLVYASRNLIGGEDATAEVSRILEGSRRRNAARGITGALLFGEDAFVQVLEGPIDALEPLFERIQCDPRHADVVVLDAGPATERHFAAWSMAYGGRRDDIRFAALRAVQGEAGAAPIMALLRSALGRLEEAA